MGKPYRNAGARRAWALRAFTTEARANSAAFDLMSDLLCLEAKRQGLVAALIQHMHPPLVT
jgi:hypothetical protein